MRFAIQSPEMHGPRYFRRTGTRRRNQCVGLRARPALIVPDMAAHSRPEMRSALHMLADASRTSRAKHGRYVDDTECPR